MNSLLSSFFVVWRETFEALLVIFLLWTALSRSQSWEKSKRFLMAGSGLGLVLSAVFAWVVFQYTEETEGTFATILKSAAPLIAAGLMLHMVVWMAKHAREISGEIREIAHSHNSWSLTWGVFILISYTISREGFETVVYLYGMSLNPRNATLSWAHYAGILALGTGASVMCLVALKKGLGFFNLKTFFRATNVFLLATAASLLVVGVNSLIEGEFLPALIDPIWDTSNILSGESTLGQTLNLLMGYTPQPSLALVLIYAVFWLLAVLLMVPRRSFAKASEPAAVAV